MNKKKGSAPVRWFKRMVLGPSQEIKDDRYDSPTKQAVKRFFRNPLATGAVIVLIGMFLFVFIGSAIAPVDLTETGTEVMHTNVSPTNSLMKLPESMKTNVRSEEHTSELQSQR